VQPLAEVDHAILDGDPAGFVKIHARQGTDRILGTTIVAPHSGEMAGEVTFAMVGGLGLKTLARTIHAYPTQTEAPKKTVDPYNRIRLTPRVKSLLTTWLAWRR
jgi:pyruvate/2-oxoglutarate dehydrogenase complex dihydrolipoamide dehydrogenase (E3) component